MLSQRVLAACPCLQAYQHLNPGEREEHIPCGGYVSLAHPGDSPTGLAVSGKLRKDGLNQELSNNIHYTPTKEIQSKIYLLYGLLRNVLHHGY